MYMSVSINPHFRQLPTSYLFSEIVNRVNAFQAANPEADIIRLGMGDVTLPLTPCVVSAMHKAADEMANQTTFHGYAPENGYGFLRQAIANRYQAFDAQVDAEEVFVSDGAKSDAGNITDIFDSNEVLLPNPMYPVYADSNTMCGRKVTLLDGTAENNFLPMPNGLSGKSSLIYLCSPNNPTGAVYSKSQLETWVHYANETKSVIIFDAAYEAYIQEAYPHTIYEIPGARSCAIEICSLSKTAGFTGMRCAWTVIPKELTAEGVPLHHLWHRRQATKFNGVAYVIQRAAEAALSQQGQAECRQLVRYYRQNAAVLAQVLREKGIWFTGGTNAPYLWMQCPNGRRSWQFFEELLSQMHIVGTPGVGFGTQGEGYFRLSAFASHAATQEAAQRMREKL
jgi:LL-diaminopimelate aminotransferase